MKRKKMTIYNPDGTEDVFLSIPYEDRGSYFAYGHTANGYYINLDDGSQILCSTFFS